MSNSVITPVHNTTVCGFGSNVRTKYHLVTISEDKLKEFVKVFNIKDGMYLLDDEEKDEVIVSKEESDAKTVKMYGVEVSKLALKLAGPIDDNLTHNMCVRYISPKHYDGVWVKLPNNKMTQKYEDAVFGLKRLAAKLRPSDNYAIIELPAVITLDKEE